MTVIIDYVRGLIVKQQTWPMHACDPLIASRPVVFPSSPYGISISNWLAMVL